jgi:hypothetical protein
MASLMICSGLSEGNTATVYFCFSQLSDNDQTAILAKKIASNQGFQNCY